MVRKWLSGSCQLRAGLVLSDSLVPVCQSNATEKCFIPEAVRAVNERQPQSQ